MRCSFGYFSSFSRHHGRMNHQSTAYSKRQKREERRHPPSHLCNESMQQSKQHKKARSRSVNSAINEEKNSKMNFRFLILALVTACTFAFSPQRCTASLSRNVRSSSIISLVKSSGDFPPEEESEDSFRERVYDADVVVDDLNIVELPLVLSGRVPLSYSS